MYHTFIHTSLLRQFWYLNRQGKSVLFKYYITVTLLFLFECLNSIIMFSKYWLHTNTYINTGFYTFESFVKDARSVSLYPKLSVTIVAICQE